MASPRAARFHAGASSNDHAYWFGTALQITSPNATSTQSRGTFACGAPHMPFAPAIARRVKKGGCLILAGLLRPEEDEIRAAYSMLRIVATSTENDWLSVVCERP